MEIISYVLDGALEHKTASATAPRSARRGAAHDAGTGITHSEYNPSPSQTVHFLQIWILPERDGLPPATSSASSRRRRSRPAQAGGVADGSEGR